MSTWEDSARPAGLRLAGGVAGSPTVAALTGCCGLLCACARSPRAVPASGMDSHASPPAWRVPWIPGSLFSSVPLDSTDARLNQWHGCNVVR